MYWIYSKSSVPAPLVAGGFTVRVEFLPIDKGKVERLSHDKEKCGMSASHLT